MQYDPIKDRLERLTRRSPAAQKAFYALLHVIFLRSWYVRREVRRLLAGLHRDVDVLDAGTGFGQYAYFVARAFPNVHVLAVDLKEEYLDYARRLVTGSPVAGRVAFAAHDLTVLDVDRRFDLVLSVDVMEHIEDDRAVLRNFARVLKPGGRVLINTPSDMGGSDVAGAGDDSFIDEHVRPGYGLDELLSKLDEAGLEPERALYTYGPYGARAWRMLVKWPMRMLARTRLALVVLPLYYAVTLPLGSALHLIDMRARNVRGTGLLVVARKVN